MSHEPYANPFGDTSMPQQIASLRAEMERTTFYCQVVSHRLWHVLWGNNQLVDEVDALRAEVARKDFTIKQLLRCIQMNSNGCPPNIEGKKPWCRTKRGPDGAGSSTDLCGRDMGECWDEWESIVTARKEGGE